MSRSRLICSKFSSLKSAPEFSSLSPFSLFPNAAPAAMPRLASLWLPFPSSRTPRSRIYPQKTASPYSSTSNPPPSSEILPGRITRVCLPNRTSAHCRVLESAYAVKSKYRSLPAPPPPANTPRENSPKSGKAEEKRTEKKEEIHKKKRFLFFFFNSFVFFLFLIISEIFQKY